jgi:hypothetical protein
MRPANMYIRGFANAQLVNARTQHLPHRLYYFSNMFYFLMLFQYVAALKMRMGK